MDFWFYQVLGDLIDAEEQAIEPAREFLQGRNPFDLPDRKFIRYFRVNKDLAREIIRLVTPFIVPPSRVSALSIETKVFVALKFFGYGSYQEMTGTNMYTGVSQPSVSRCIRDVCEAFLQPAIFNTWVHFPRNIRELENTRRRFYEKYDFPGVVGVIDCTHVAIVPPRGDPHRPEYVYVNRKSYHSINICDEKLKIMNVNARFPGSTHDAHIWRQSNISITMENIYRHNEENPLFLLGDSGYPLRPWLMTPLENPPDPNTPAENFNNVLKRVRSTIERCNGVLKNRFRCLLKHRVLHYTPQVAANIINTCVVLHNMCIHYNVPEPEDDDVINNMDIGRHENEPNQDLIAGRVNPDLAAGRRLQQRIIENYFGNNE